MEPSLLLSGACPLVDYKACLHLTQEGFQLVLSAVGTLAVPLPSVASRPGPNRRQLRPRSPCSSDLATHLEPVRLRNPTSTGLALVVVAEQQIILGSGVVSALSHLHPVFLTTIEACMSHERQELLLTLAPCSSRQRRATYEAVPVGVQQLEPRSIKSGLGGASC